MKRVNVGDSECPISQSVGRVGDWWSLLLVLDAFLGFTRFEQFQENLRISPGMLTRRLKTLVEDGVLERRKYHARPPRYEYLLTASGHQLLPLLVALYTWGTVGTAPDARSMLLTDRTGRELHPLLVDAGTGRPLTVEDTLFVAGPGASAPFRHYLDRAPRFADQLHKEATAVRSSSE